MATARTTATRATETAHGAVRSASPWIERLGRAGLAAKGIVYALVGLLAAQAALGAGGATTDKQGALASILQAPFGQVLLAAIAVGLLGYALWRFVQAGYDTEDKGTDAKGWLARAGYAVSGGVYLALAWSAVRLLLNAAGSDSEQTTQDLTARALAAPAGAWLVGLVGAGLVANGLYQGYRAVNAKFGEKLRLDDLAAGARTWIVRLGRAGYAARGVVFVLIGGFLIAAARAAEPGQAHGLGGALAELAARPFGPWLLGAVAVGLIAYGLFELVEARYRQIVVR